MCLSYEEWVTGYKLLVPPFYKSWHKDTVFIKR